jgi:glucose/arabinose dehydrogenase
MRRLSPPRRIARIVCLLAAGSTMAVAGGGCITPPKLTVTTVVTGLDHPWDIGFVGTTMIYTERPGRISAIVNGQKRLLAAPADVIQASEAGMMGLAIDPAFTTNRFIYTCFASTLGGANGDVRLVRWTVDANFTALTNRTDIVTGAPVNATGELGRHSGCRPRFDSQARLWVGTGDAASGTVPQNPRSLGGKVLRINRDGTGVAGNPGGALDPRIYSYGHRNVQGIAFRPSDGFGVTTEHGPDRDDELNALVTGNFGWNPVPPSGTGYNEAVPMTDLAEFPNAVRSLWSTGPRTFALSGATFITGSQWGQWNGALAIALLKDSKLLLLKLDSTGHPTNAGLAIGNRGRLRSPVQGPDGNLYITTDNGGSNDVILKVVPG